MKMEAGQPDAARVRRQRWSLLVSALLTVIILAVVVVLLLSAASEFLPDVPGLDYGLVQGGLLLLTLLFGIYTLDRDRRLRQANERLTKELLETGRLRTQDEMKSAFLRALSHDLRTPLTAILTATSLLQRHRDRLPPEVFEETLGRIAGQAHRLDLMLSDMLDLERIERAVEAPQRQPVDLGAVVREALESVETGDRPLELDAEEVVAAVDGAQVRRIVDNLVSNAVKHTDPGTPIRVEVRSADDTEGPGAMLIVEDRGPGIPDQSKKAVFEAFQRGADAGDRDGVGLGLHLVSKFAELHGGRVWVEDREGGGASFRVLFPERRRRAS